MVIENNENYRNHLIEMVKTSGLELIDRAEDLVGDGDLICDLDIWLRFRANEAPYIESTRSHISRRGVDVLMSKNNIAKDRTVMLLKEIESLLNHAPIEDDCSDKENNMYSDMANLKISIEDFLEEQMNEP